jgi:hypothetical protein
MRLYHLSLSLELLLASPGLIAGQDPSDTAPARVADRAYEALNSCNRAAYFALFAPTWYHSNLEDTTSTAIRRSHDEGTGPTPPNTYWAACGDIPTGVPAPGMHSLSRLTLGPYVVDKEANANGTYVLLNIFEVRHGKILHLRESAGYAGRPAGTAPE